MDKLRSLELFLATCDGGGFAAAARSCNTDPSTVSKAIARLEAQLGLTLFQRSTRQFRITDAGTHYAHTARQILQTLSSCEEELKHLNDSPRGVLRISSAVCYSHLYLRPLLKEFCHRYPRINLDISVTDLHEDIIDNDIDIAKTPLADIVKLPEAFEFVTPEETKLPLAEGQRLICIGDIHGDCVALREALAIAGVYERGEGNNGRDGEGKPAIDEDGKVKKNLELSGKWIGGNTIVVQTGDV